MQQVGTAPAPRPCYCAWQAVMDDALALHCWPACASRLSDSASHFSVRELSVARNSQLRLTPQAAEQLAALPQLRCLRISVNRGAPAELEGEAEEAHLAGLRRLLQLLRGRLVLE